MPPNWIDWALISSMWSRHELRSFNLLVETGCDTMRLLMAGKIDLILPDDGEDCGARRWISNLNILWNCHKKN
jgi:hypothetical protein